MLPPCCVRATQTIISCSMSLRRSMTFQSSTIKSWTLAGLITWPHHLSASAGVWRSLFVCGSLFVAASSDGQLQEHKEGRPTHEHTHTHTLSLSHTHTHTHTLTHTFWPQLSGAASSTRWDHGWTAILPTLLLCTAKAARAERALLLLRISATSESLTSASTLLLLLLLHTRARTHTHAHTHTHPLISTPALCLTSRFP